MLQHFQQSESAFVGQQYIEVSLPLSGDLVAYVLSSLWLECCGVEVFQNSRVRGFNGAWIGLAPCRDQ